MATYVNDLRLKEIATGDESGTWGTSTNTNLELIADAFSYATKDCFATDADATETMADGVADEIRSLYLKVTSSATLTATRTLTLAPNTVSKTWIIENATTGGQSISISQGSGANVTIPNGDTKIIYTDGAGAGAAVTDAFANLNVGDLTATNIAGTLTTAAQPNITSVGTLTGFTSTGIDDNATSTAITIDSDENVGIGNTNPAYNLEIWGAADPAVRVYNTGTGSSSDSLLRLQIAGTTARNFIYFGDTDDQDIGNIEYNHSDNSMRFTTNTVEAFRVDSSGNVGIGTSSPSDFAANANNLVVGSGSGTEGITINSGTANYGVIYFADGTSGSAAYAGNINYNHADNSMRLGTNGSTTDVVIDSSGNVGINTTAPATLLHIKADSNSTTDFPITIENLADTLDVGIGTYGLSNKVGTSQTSDFTMTIGDDLYLACDTVRLPDGADLIVQENDSTTSAIRLTSDANEGFLQVYTDGVQKVQIRGNGDNYIIDNNFGIGTSSPAKDLDVSGEIRASTGILFGTDTAAANTLDDYEEGTWRPTIAGQTSAGTYTYGENAGQYVKIGNQVTCTFYIVDITEVSAGSGNLIVDNLPFTAANVTAGTVMDYYWGSCNLEYFDVNPSTVNLSVAVDAGSTICLFWETLDGTVNGLVAVTDLNSSGNADVWGQVTYRTT